MGMLRALVIVLLSCAVSCAQVAGKVDRVVPAGFLIHDKNTAEAKPADLVSWNDIARTNEKGRMRLALEDGSQLTVGSKAELRVVKHDKNTQQTTIEMLYGTMRMTVAPQTKSDSSFQVRTPTAVIGAIGTGAIIRAVDTQSVTPVTNVSGEQIANLPAGRNIQSLIDALPGAGPGSGPSIADYGRVNQTDVYALDHVVGVRNIDPAIKGTVYVSPGQMTTVRRGQPPTAPVPFDFLNGMPQQARNDLQLTMDDLDRSCTSTLVIDGKIVASADSDAVGKVVDYILSGRGTGSTGNVLRAQFTNPFACDMNVLMHAGTVLQPFSFTGGMKGINHSNYQVMLTFGGFWTIPPAVAPPPPPPPPPAMFFTPPESAASEIVLQGYCLERAKLAPHPATKYKFADPSLQSQFTGYQKFVDKAHELYLNNQMQSTVPLDLVIQWAIWIDQEKMNEKAFREAHWKIVEKAMEEQHRKLDKEMKARVEAMQNDLWPNAQKLIAAVR